MIPKTLAANAARDSSELVANLRLFHNKAQKSKESSHFKWYVALLIQNFEFETVICYVGFEKAYFFPVYLVNFF